jgi:hypothetical protein
VGNKNSWGVRLEIRLRKNSAKGLAYSDRLLSTIAT